MDSEKKSNIALLVALLSGLVSFGTLFRLSVRHFPEISILSVVYIVYVISLIVFIHALAFFFHYHKELKTGTGLSNQAPKSVDYGITVLLSVAIIQIAYAEGWLAKYTSTVTDAPTVIVNKIESQAREHLQTDCGKNSFFTKEYCNELSKIIKQPDLLHYINNELSKNTSFLEHKIGYIAGMQGATAPVYSPIRDYVFEIGARTEYARARAYDDQRLAWSWVTLLLLPWVIALRAMKTSLELFARPTS